MFLLVAFFCALCVADSWVEIVEYVNRDSENCPTLAQNGQKTGAFTGQAFDLQTGVQRPTNVAPDCVATSGYGLNQFLTQIIPKANYSVGISISSGNTTVGNLTINDYNCSSCLCPVRNTKTLKLNTCIKNGIENGKSYSRYFQITPKLPPGYQIIGKPTVPSKFTLEWYLASPGGLCQVNARTTQYANSQKCQAVNDRVWINGYCADSATFTGCVATDQNCLNCTTFTQPLTQTCVADFTNFASGPINGQTLPNAVSKIIVRCSSTSLTVSILVPLIFTFLSFAFYM